MRNRPTNSNDSLTAPVCWQREAPTACLRIEMPSGEMHLFSYQHFVTASLKRADGGQETLRIAFSGHDVEVDGHALRDLLLGLQDFGVKWVRTAPEHYRGLAKDSCTVSAIRISAVG